MPEIRDYSVILRLIMESDQFKKESKKLGGEIKGVEKQFGGLQKRLGAAISIAAILAIGKQLAQLSLEMDAVDKKASVVFGKTLPRINEEARKNALQLGLTTNEYIRLAAASQDLLVPMQFTREEAANISIEIQNLSGALSEWSAGKRSATEVSEILTKALLGEREQLKTLGVDLKEADITQELVANGQEKLTGNALKQAKAQATLRLILQRTTDAQAAFNENQDSSIRNVAKLSAGLRQIGEDVARTFSGLVSGASALIDPDRLIGAVRKTIAQIRGFFTGIGAVISNFQRGLNEFSVNFELRLANIRKNILSAFGGDTSEIESRIRALTARLKVLEETGENAGESFREAFSRGYDEGFAVFEAKAVQDAEDTGEVIGEGLGKGLTKAQKKALEDFRKRAEKAFKETQEAIQDLEVSLIVNEDDRARAELELSLAREFERIQGLIKEGLIPNDLGEELQRLLGIQLERALSRVELDSLVNEFQKIGEKLKNGIKNNFELDGVVSESFFTEDEVNKLEKLAEEGIERIKEISQDAAKRGVGETSLLEDLFGGIDFDKIEQNLNGVKDKVLPLIDQIFGGAQDTDLLDARIENSIKRINEFSQFQSEAAQEQVRIEQERLEAFQAQRERAIANQQRLASLEIAINSALAISSAIKGAIKAFAENPFLGVLQIGAAISGLLAFVGAVRGVISGVPTFHEGEEEITKTSGTKTFGKLKSDEKIVKVQLGERILSKDQNRELMAMGLSNKDLVEVAKRYKDGRFALPLGLDSMDLSSLANQRTLASLGIGARINSDFLKGKSSDPQAKILDRLDRVIEAQEKTAQKVDDLEFNFKLDKDGFAANLVRSVSKANKRKRYAPK